MIALDEPYVITENSNFLMNFRTTESVSIDFDSKSPYRYKPGGITEPTILKVGLYANPIQAFLTVTRYLLLDSKRNIASNEVIATPFGNTVSNGASNRSNMNCSNNTSDLLWPNSHTK